MGEHYSFFRKVKYELHIAAGVRKKYKTDDMLFSSRGNLVFADFNAVRKLAHQLNLKRTPKNHIYPGELNAAGLLDEIFHFLLRHYEEQVDKEVFVKAAGWMLERLGRKELQDLMLDFTEKFPPFAVYKGKMTAADYLAGHSDGRPNILIAMEEAMMLYLNNFNQANKKLKELFDLNYLENIRVFEKYIRELDNFFKEQPFFGPDNQDVFTFLKAPILDSPNDLNAQLDFIEKKWGKLISEKFVLRILKGKDLMKEDLRLGEPGGGPPPAMAPRYKGTMEGEGFLLGKSGFDYMKDSVRDYEEHEQFTPDTHWMPKVVMLAKNTYVWLDQLSKKYQRLIRRLDQIPDEELDQLAGWNFNGLWLIGIWERSRASRRIKHIMGNTDAVASAYSLYDYEIAADLGGEQAYHNLNERARARGIRLASDMVPNHTGVYSRWVVENPDYFIQTRTPPFPSYSFSGENLSQHPDIEIRIEDGYYTKSDAAVVFQRIDKRYNDIRYIYHGNDGTAMPWNDTAQLDMLKQEVREAVIGKIFDVARRFSIIRFDAAMTLAKKHFSRLWYPRPGSGGDIPSRADYAMTQKQFDELFPVEFWREVVDRINREMPETLLLAEAFWFMEGYFVRTLGMHRVYNSAFMHMLKNEENEKYRDLITNTLEFEPEILNRYVNFMSNPDEETAIQQFGSGDKYFGVCVLMVTLPGLPMFAHGQIEGYTEKYGMEYQRAYYNESPNLWLVERHHKEIVPLMEKRALFSEVNFFNIFDFVNEHGHVNENVFAYTNRHGNERALVLFNNRYEQASGRIFHSAPKLSAGDGDKKPVSVTLPEALSLKNSEDVFYIFREHISGLQHIRTGREIHENGFHWNLQGFEYRVFIDFQEIPIPGEELKKLYHELGGRPVEDAEKALQQVKLEKIHSAFLEVFHEETIRLIVDGVVKRGLKGLRKSDFQQGKERFKECSQQIALEHGAHIQTKSATEEFTESLYSLEKAFKYFELKKEQLKTFSLKTEGKTLEDLLVIGPGNAYRENSIFLLAFFTLRALKELAPENKNKFNFLKELMLQWPLEELLKKTGRGKQDINLDIILLEALLKYDHSVFDFSDLPKSAPGKKRQDTGLPAAMLKKKVAFFQKMFEDQKVCDFLGVNLYQNTLYYSKERFEELNQWLFSISLFDYFNPAKITPDKRRLPSIIRSSMEFYRFMEQCSEQSEYKLEKVKSGIRKFSSARKAR